MALLDDLEAQLRGDWDRETIAVYGDQLQALGDPRGELIAIDLAIEDSGPTPSLAGRRAALVDVWLGGTPPNGTIRCGFIDLDATGGDPVAQVKAAYEHRAAPHIRSVTIAGSPKQIAAALAMMQRAPRPSLVKLVIRQWAEQEQATLADPSTLIVATPYLRTVEIAGRNVFGDFAHSAVRMLRVSGFDAIRTLPDGRLALPALTALDLALHCHIAGKQVDPPPGLFPTLGLHCPALVDLDLSRNAPGYHDPKTLGGKTDIFVAVKEISIRSQLRTLRLPPGNPADLAAIRELFPQSVIST